jgi:hypothetical protein
LTALVDPLFPQFKGAFLAAFGLNFAGRAARIDPKSKGSQGEVPLAVKASMAVNSLLEAFVPGVGDRSPRGGGRVDAVRQLDGPVAEDEAGDEGSGRRGEQDLESGAADRVEGAGRRDRHGPDTVASVLLGWAGADGAGRDACRDDRECSASAARHERG